MAEDKKKQYLAMYFNPNSFNPFKTIEKDGKRSKSVSDVQNIVFPGQVLISIVDEKYTDSKVYEKQEYAGILAGKNTEFVESTNQYKSLIYGHVVLSGRKIAVEPLIEFSSDKAVAYLYHLPNKEGRVPNVDEIMTTLLKLNYKGALSDGQIRHQLEKLSESGKKTGIITVCKGVPAKNGQIEHYVLLKDINKKVGRVLENDRINFKEKDIFIPVVKGEPILELKPMLPPQDGFDVLGGVLKGQMEGEKLFIPGKNLEISKEKPNIFVAALSGVLFVDSRKVSIESKVTINKDINLETGNINVEGSVEIFGNVTSGFEVHAGADIIIHGNVEDAIVSAAGNIIIDNGILGKEKTLIEAGNNIAIRFAQNSRLRAGNDILIKESLIQCNVQAKNTIKVDGTVVGGELMGKYGITVKTAGSEKGVETKLIVGKDPEIEQKLQEKNELLKKQESLYTNNLEDMKMQFGNQFLSDLKGFLAVLRGTRKVKFIEMLTKLSEYSKEVNKLKQEIQELRSLITFAVPPFIVVHERVYSDVVISIKKAILRIPKERLGTTFKEDDQTGTIIEKI